MTTARLSPVSAATFRILELLYWAGNFQSHAKAKPPVVSPAHLLELGEVIYFSGARDDQRVRNVAVSRS